MTNLAAPGFEYPGTANEYPGITGTRWLILDPNWKTGPKLTARGKKEPLEDNEIFGGPKSDPNQRCISKNNRLETD